MGWFLGRLARVGAVTAMFGAMCGCAGVQPKTLETGTTMTKELRVRTHDAQGQAISDNRVKDAIAAALIAGGNRPTDYSERFLNPGNKYPFGYGVKATTTANGIEVSYLNGPSYHQSRITAIFPLSMSKSDDGDLYRAVLGFPSRADMVPPEFIPLVSPSDYPLEESQVVPNLMSKFNALNRVEVMTTAHITGEVTVDAGSDAVRGNLDRILGKYQDYENGYNLKVGELTQPLSIKLYPYKSGCKMQYAVDVPYSVSETTSLTEADIEAIKKKIESVAKD